MPHTLLSLRYVVNRLYPEVLKPYKELRDFVVSETLTAKLWTKVIPTTEGVPDDVIEVLEPSSDGDSGDAASGDECCDRGALPGHMGRDWRQAVAKPPRR